MCDSWSDHARHSPVFVSETKVYDAVVGDGVIFAILTLPVCTAA